MAGNAEAGKTQPDGGGTVARQGGDDVSGARAVMEGAKGVRAITVTLPLPPKGLHPNSAVGGFGRSRARKKAREDACYAGMTHFPGSPYLPIYQRPVVTLVYFFRVRRDHDADNLIAWAKSYFDGLQDAGLWKNDNLVRHEQPLILLDKRDPRLEIRVQEGA